MKKKGLNKVIAVLALSSTALLFAGCKGKNKVTQAPVDDDIKYDASLKMRYKVFNGEAEIVEIEKQGATLTIPKSIDGNTVTRVSCTYTDAELTSVTIPNTLNYLTGNGFMGCENLETVTFEENANIADIPSKAFLGTKITSITIPASVRSISFEAFQDVDTLTSVTFESGSNLETVGPFAFYGCDGLTTVTLPSKLTSIGASAFEKCENLTTINNTGATKLTTIEEYAFSGCSKITTLNLTSNAVLTKIGANAFRGCTALTSVTFDDALKEIGSKAFYNTQNISKLVLPSSLTKVGDEAFVNAGITELEVKSGADTQFGVNAFSQYILVGEKLQPVEKITKLTVDGNLSLDKVFTDYAKQVRASLTDLHVTGNRIASSSYKGCVNLTNLDIDTTVKAIEESAFEDCIGITEVTLSNQIDEIAVNTFKNCINLTTITLPTECTVVRSGAFDGCVNVSNLDLSNLIVIGDAAFRNTKVPTPTFSENLQTIGESAFENCQFIESVTVDTVVPSTTIKKYAFSNCKSITAIDLSSNVITEGNSFVGDTNVVSLAVRGEYGLETLFGESRETAAKKIEEIEIKDNTKAIEANAFAGCLLVTEITIPDTVTVIGDGAFKGCRGITKIDLYDTLEKVGAYAFADCDKLGSDASYDTTPFSLPKDVVELSEGVFANDFSIKTFALNEQTTKIGSYAFKGCTNLIIESFNDSIEYIGDYAFAECLKLEINRKALVPVEDESDPDYPEKIEIKPNELPASLVELGSYAFSGCLLVNVKATNANLTKLGAYAFKGCQSIGSFEFANDLALTDSLGESILEGCTNVTELSIYGSTSLEYIFGESVKELKPVLSTVTIKEGTTSLADNMFKGFTAISVVNLPTTTKITSIGEYAFAECESLTFMDITMVESIGKFAFYKSGLTSITIPSNGIVLGEGVFASCTSLSVLEFEDASTDDSKNIKVIPDYTFSGTILIDIVLPDSVTKIGKEAFGGILTLNTFTISETSNLETISQAAFTGCSNVLDIYIPSKVISLGDGAFLNCHALRNVTFATDNKIDKILANTFCECYALTTINLPNTIRSIGDNAFESCTCLTRLTLPTTLDEIGVCAFLDCQSINNITIPEKIEIIPNSAFSGCYMLENVTWNSNIKIISDEAFYNSAYRTAIPKTVSMIGKSAFASEEDCLVRTFAGKEVSGVFTPDVVELGNDANGVSLYISDEAFSFSAVGSVVFGAKITDMGKKLFYKSTVTSANFTNLKIAKIADSMFEECAALTTVTLTDNTSINTIGDYAFKKSGITSFAFTNILAIGTSSFEETGALDQAVSLGVTSNITIGDSAFYKSGINKITLGEYVIKLGATAFSESKIKEAHLDKLNVTTIAASFFENCDKLTTVTINSNIRVIGASAFFGTKITNLDFLRHFDEDDPSIEITKLEQIGDNAFGDCKALLSAVIPDTVSFVGSSAFSGCDSLTSMKWSKNANVIGDNTFQNCNNLTTIIIPDNVSRIGATAFSPVPTLGLATIKFEGAIPPSVDEKFVSDYTKVMIQVPNDSLSDYLMNYVFAKIVPADHIEGYNA